MAAGLEGVAGHSVAVDPHETLGLTDATALFDVFEHGGGLLPGQVGTKERGALAFGEPSVARATPKETDRRRVLAIMAADGEVFQTPDAMIGTLGIQAAEPREIIHGPPPTT